MPYNTDIEGSTSSPADNEQETNDMNANATDNIFTEVLNNDGTVIFNGVTYCRTVKESGPFTRASLLANSDSVIAQNANQMKLWKDKTIYNCVAYSNNNLFHIHSIDKQAA